MGTVAPMFNFEGHNVRVVMRENNPWFVAVDVARALQLYLKGGNSVNTATMVRPLGNDEQEYVAPRELGGIVDNRVGMFLTISESGLYKLIMRAKPHKNDRVKKFQDWVTKEVLPAIRKDGAYIYGEEKVRTGELSEDEFILKAMTILKSKAERLTQELAATTTQKEHLAGIVEEHLVHLTIDEWRALNGQYFTKSRAN